MGYFTKMFSQLASPDVVNMVNQQVAQATGGAVGGSSGTGTSGGPKQSSTTTRWEKAVVGLDKIVNQVVRVDPNGVDIVCFGGEGDAQWYRNVKETKGLEEMVNDKRPRGRCYMGAAMEECVKDAFDEDTSADLRKRPVAILVLTAGKPDDTAELDETLNKTVNRIAESFTTCPLSITFVQIGNDEEATDYLKHLDNHVQAECKENGETFDLVDTIKDEEIQAAMKEIQDSTSGSGMTGGLIGAFAGAAMGVGGMYLYNKQQAKKRTEGWNGKWKCSYDGDEIAQLTVTDDLQGTLTIEGFPEEEATTGSYTADGDSDQYEINFVDPAGDGVEGTVEDEHTIVWSDGTRWEEIPPDGTGWKEYAAAGLGGAAAGGATGYLLDKKFFNKASKKDECDYIILMDRSSKMAVVDYDDE